MTTPLRTEKDQKAYVRRAKNKCRNKNAYVSPDAAKAAGRRHISHGGAGALWYYQCLLCMAWHLTSKDQGAAHAVHFTGVSK